MSHYLILSIVWAFLGAFFFGFYLVEAFRIIPINPLTDSKIVTTILLILLSASSFFVSAFWLWRGIIWARTVIGFIAVVFAVGCWMAVWVRNWWGALGILDAFLVMGICLSVYTLYVFLTKRPS